MKHQDEQQAFSPQKEAQRAKYMPNFDQLVSDYEHLLIRSRRDSQQVVQLRSELAKYKQQLAALEAREHKLRAENLKLKKTLTALRNSTSVKAGRAVTLPARLVVKAIRRASPTGPALPTSVDSTSATQPVGGGVAGDTIVAAPPVDPVMLNKTYREAIETNGTLENILRFANHSYFVLGKISEPAAVIRANSELLTGLSVKDARLVRVIMGFDELLRNEPQIPPRQPNAGYQVERNRVLYCAHSTGHFNSNGYSTRTAGVIRGLTGQGKDVVTMARPGYPWDVKVDVKKPVVGRFTKTINGVEHVYNPCLSWTDDRLDHYLLAAIDTYVREAQRQRASLIHSASNYVTALPALIASRRLGIPFVYEVRGLWEVTGASGRPGWEESERYKFSERMETLVARHADHVFAITAQIKEELVRRGVDADKITLLPNAVDTTDFTPMPPYLPLRAKLNLPADVPVIGYAGSMVHYEGLSALLKATRRMVDSGRDLRVVLVGDGPELDSLKAESEALQLTETVTFTGRVPAEDISNYISIFDVMPCPRLSLPVTELVSPLKPLEAMACAKALVLTRVAPLIDLAGQDEHRAILVEPSNPNSLAEGILRLLDDPELQSVLGRRARLWTVQERTWDLSGKLAIEAYGNVLEGYRHADDAAPTLRQMRLAIVADTFTTEGLRPETDLLELRPGSWREQLEDAPADALLVESAWEGIDNEWNQRVGFYSDEQFSTMRDLLAYCRERAIPTIFWNKEDPVHFNRFKNSAKHFDHIFTTDADCINDYAELAGPNVKSISSLPFYAQPKIHNPLPSRRAYSHSVAYAGTFYGERYKERSQELGQLLDAVKPFGLTIYDRQLLNPNSPYRFPAELNRYVSEGLGYLEMVEAYKAHPVHINVNSVAESPTMFSRRVVELAASGSTIISGRGRGVEDVMAGLVYSVKSSSEAAILADRWMNDEEARIHDAWLAYRLVHRGHTAAHRLAYVLRTAGLTVTAPQHSGYALQLDALTAAAVASVSKLTVLPNVIVYDRADEGVILPAGTVGVDSSQLTHDVLSSNGVSWMGPFVADLDDRTAYEDLLTSESFGTWDELSFTDEQLDVPGHTLAVPGEGQISHLNSAIPLLRRIHAEATAGQGDRLQMRRSISFTGAQAPAQTAEVARTSGFCARTILVAGHDLKFARGIIAEMENQGHRVLVDQWDGHAQHDEERSRKLLVEADTIFCEWTLGNAVWYAENVGPHQRLVTRLHSQEVFTPYLKMLKHERVDQIMVVGRHIADIAVRDHGVPRNRLVLIPNSVDVPLETLPKDNSARFRLGMVGIVPAQKHLDRALDLLSMLRANDRRYTLSIKGKKPEDYSWMAHRPEEMAYYEEQYARLRTDPNLVGAVAFDGFGNDMADWYGKIGVVLSVSDFESFHLTIADGAAHGALPAVLGWPGSDHIYPASWISASIPELADGIRRGTQEEALYDQLTFDARAYVRSSFCSTTVLPAITSLIVGNNDAKQYVRGN
ncbi:glycosyltransferase [Arthrobacter gengyunqii]|uniref:D-inositol 3-phosphate glycosyltransferase n=1 Tax=Arthrobacter gengyunqii TaxID=2886940 RepID=A0A9X1M229_9MICC|nr:glycosyltransferase [Arthrobacter gengyunqii]MCC3269913.1 glycosyltransferase [Arthrobacter gengyunqii]UOY95156.1 glycosyltransferase [Arthrobacter gengyunqii]